MLWIIFAVYVHHVMCTRIRIRHGIWLAYIFARYIHFWALSSGCNGNQSGCRIKIAPGANQILPHAVAASPHMRRRMSVNSTVHFVYVRFSCGSRTSGAGCRTGQVWTQPKYEHYHYIRSFGNVRFSSESNVGQVCSFAIHLSVRECSVSLRVRSNMIACTISDKYEQYHCIRLFGCVRFSSKSHVRCRMCDEG